MKNNIIKKISLLLFVVLFVNCSETVNYKYQDKKQFINCNSEDDPLLNEALHSFEFDIATYYQSINSDIRTLDIEYSYANFIYSAALGNVDLTKIVSEYSLQILNKLKEKGYLNNPKSQKSNLNYYKEEVACIVDHIKKEDLKTSLKSQIAINFLDPKLMADNYRINIREAHTDKYFAMFLALETYYQYLADIDFSK